MGTPKKYISILIILALLLSACIIVSKTVDARAQNAENESEMLYEQEEMLAQEKEAVPPEPSEEQLPEATEMVTPEPTPEATPMIMPELTPEVTPISAPVITKNPTNETVAPGNTAYFIAKADGATTISWFLASPDGSKGINAKDISAEFQYTSCTGTDGEQLGIVGIDRNMDGWKVICKFSGPGGVTFSEPAYIAVLGNSQQLRSLDEVLVLVLNKKEAQTAGVSLANAANTAMIADFFTETVVSADEVKKAVQAYTQHLSEAHRAKYKGNADELIDEFHRAYVEDVGFKGSLDTCGYTAKYYPWKDERVVSCFEALGID